MNTDSHLMYEWKTLPWRQLERQVFKLQKRIYRASQRGDVKTVHRLQRLLMRSRAARLLATRRVTQDNQGRVYSYFLSHLTHNVYATTPFLRENLAQKAGSLGGTISIHIKFLILSSELDLAQYWSNFGSFVNHTFGNFVMVGY